MMDFLKHLFSTDGFMPHGMCYEWDPKVIWLHVVSDGLISIAYYSIPLTLLYFVRKRRDLQFSWIFLCFAVFIVACGTTHLMEIWNIWHPVYWLSGSIKAVTAASSIITAILLVRLIPKALSLPSPSDLQKANEALQVEIREHNKSEEALRLLNSAVMQATESILITDGNLDLPGPTILFVNPAFTRMTGYTKEEVIGKTPPKRNGTR
jgi:PAS domain-containing protein